MRIEVPEGKIAPLPLVVQSLESDAAALNRLTPLLYGQLRRLARRTQIVELRYFGGLGIEEVAQVVAVSTGTVKREWEKARAWLRRELGRGQGE